MDLLEKWNYLASGYTGNQAVLEKYWQEIEAAYSGKGRYYHTLAHLEKMLNFAGQFRESMVDYDILCFSIWYHDIIYKVTRKDNEARSAAFAEERLTGLGLNPERIANCKQQILATRHQSDAPVSDPDTAYLLDFDLSILGAGASAYAEYARQVRKEYRIYPGVLYRKGRKQVLRYFLDLPCIYQTEYFKLTCEAAARRNLQWEIESL